MFCLYIHQAKIQICYTYSEVDFLKRSYSVPPLPVFLHIIFSLQLPKQFKETSGM